MMRPSFSAASFFLTLFLFLPVSLAWGQKAPAPRNRISIEWFNEDAARHPDSLVLKALQFTAPYAGFYQEFSLDSSGHAFTARIVPSWAVQASGRAKVDGARLDQIRQTLTHLNLAPDPPLPEPQPGQLHTAFIFYDGKAYRRYNFNGPLPARVQEILDLIRTELERGAKRQYEEFLKHRELMGQLYGDWQNKVGVAVVGGSRVHGLREARGLLLTLSGRRKTTLRAEPTEVSIYHALIFYPKGSLTGAGGGGSWSDDPRSTETVTWDVPKGIGGGDAKADKRVLGIKYQAIDGTISVGSEAYQLAAGNMFIIRMGEDWTPMVSQIEVHLDEQTTEQRVLDRFKSILRDNESIQQLELN